MSKDEVPKIERALLSDHVVKGTPVKLEPAGARACRLEAKGLHAPRECKNRCGHFEYADQDREEDFGCARRTT